MEPTTTTTPTVAPATTPGITEQGNTTILTLPGGGTIPVPTTPGGSETTPAVAPIQPQSDTDLKAYINEWQTYLKNAADTSPIDSQSPDFGLGEIPLTQMLNQDKPVLPNLEQAAAQKREELGVTTLEQEMNDLKALERDQQAIRRQRLASARGEVSRQDAIEGRVGNIERQEAERLDTINREIAYKKDLIDSANNAISVLMQYKQLDFQNAKGMWETSVQNSLNVYKQLRSEYEFDKTAEQKQTEREQDMAMANLTMYTQLITAGNLDPNTMTSSQKAEIATLETRAGLPAGFISKIKMAPGANIKEMIPRIDPKTGIKYVDILYVNPDGSIKTSTKKLGKAELSLAEQISLKNSTSGGGGSSSGTKATEKLNAARVEMNSLLARGMGGDGKVSPADYKKGKQQWTGMGFKAADYDAYFYRYVNGSHYQDYGVDAKYFSKASSTNTKTGAIDSTVNVPKSSGGGMFA